MTQLTCFKLASSIEGKPVTQWTDALETTDLQVSEPRTATGRNFVAHLVLVTTPPHDARWAGFLHSGYGDDLQVPRASAPSALLIVEVERRNRTLRFAFPFGPSGRYLLRSDAYERGYGLRTALNLIYPRAAAGASADRLRSVDTKRRGATTMRSRVQASSASTFEIFNVDRLRDVISNATGTPADSDRWGTRITGTDALSLDLDIPFAELGDLCLRVESAHGRRDYRQDFAWVDNILPVRDQTTRDQLEAEILRKLGSAVVEDLELAPPEIINWEQVSKFHYHFDRPQGPARSPVTHSDLRLEDYLRGIDRTDLTVDGLKHRYIEAFDGSGHVVHRWPVWRCLVGQFTLKGRTYVLDEGELFVVQRDYLADLDSYINAIGKPATALPNSAIGQSEGSYNEVTAAGSDDIALLDKQLVRLTGRTTGVEICDLLTRERELFHVKRHLGSSDLSHLFSQGLVSAELLQMDPEFRRAADDNVRKAATGRSGFGFFDAPAIVTNEFTVVYAIIANWKGRTAAQALPFFSKVNLRGFAEQLRARDFSVALAQIDEA